MKIPKKNILHIEKHSKSIFANTKACKKDEREMPRLLEKKSKKSSYPILITRLING